MDQLEELDSLQEWQRHRLHGGQVEDSRNVLPRMYVFRYLSQGHSPVYRWYFDVVGALIVLRIGKGLVVGCERLITKTCIWTRCELGHETKKKNPDQEVEQGDPWAGRTCHRAIPLSIQCLLREAEWDVPSRALNDHAGVHG